MSRSRLVGVLALTLVLCCSALAAEAKPAVDLHLQGVLVERTATGVEKTTPVESVALKPGETVRYTIVATNHGTDAAIGFKPVAKVPAGTVYEPAGLAESCAAGHEFSLDGGQTWSASPKVKVQTPAGTVEKPAAPQSYTSLRWIAAKPLAPKSSCTYTYQVRVK